MSLLLFFILSLTTIATSCPDSGEIVYSPFRPWFYFDYGFEGADCWSGAICTLGQADAARNQQFAATALVMGLLPLVLRDIAWPERRIVLVSKPLPALVEVIVRALGLDPMIKGAVAGWTEEEIERWEGWVRSSSIAGAGLRSNFIMKVLVAASLFMLMVSYTALALVEVYSKRSALGCVYPVIALTWCLVAVVPGAIHVLFETYRRKGGKETTNARASAVQGAGEKWPVQFAWAVYYIIGTLVYTSIMAVTPLELFVWVVVMSVVTASSKMLALYLCLLLRNPTLV